MKRLIIIILIFSMVVTMTGCTETKEPVQADIPEISDQEIHDLYAKTWKIYSWFDLSTLGADTQQEIVINDRTYCKVTEEVSSYSELIDLMESVFTGEMVEDLLSRNMYVGVDDVLYGVLADRGTDIYRGLESYEVIRKSNGEIVYEVSVEVLNDHREVTDYEVHEFALTYHDDGFWRFDDFYMVK